MTDATPSSSANPESFDRIAALRAFIEEADAFGLEELQLSPLSEDERSGDQGSDALVGSPPPKAEDSAASHAGTIPPPPSVHPAQPNSVPALAAQVPTEEAAKALLVEVAAEVAACTKCGLCETRLNTVPGQGSPSARLMFVGEAPGADEDQQGLAFVGRAGQLLTKMIGAMGLSRDEVFIANLLKCRPPGNRDPREDEANACISYLERQIQAVGPELIVALGAQAMRGLLKTTAPVGRMRGRMHQFQQTPLLVTYHPAYLLRSPQMKRGAWEDLKGAMDFLGLTPPSPAQS